ncbi:MAG: hypothetical protein Q8N23_36005 [Archangium sp.]|nr:hypothetical protein [Archangium sp.]MDP3158132.1 hypothetical protein [Archangium sp.]MDP3570461.1 hypothetical protein [Archangium sp.]
MALLRTTSLTVALLAFNVFAAGPEVRGGDDPPQDLRLSGCSLDAEAVSRGRLFELRPEGATTQMLWVGLVGSAEPHLIFAWYPRGRPARARCVDAGLVDPWALEFSTLPSLPLVRATQTLRGGCYTVSRTVVLAWTSGAHDFEVVSSRTGGSANVECGSPSLEPRPEDERLARVEAMLTRGENHDAERLILGLVAERPWDPDARSALSHVRRALSAAGRR